MPSANLPHKEREITADSCGNTRITGYVGTTQDLRGALRTKTLKPQVSHWVLFTMD